MGEESDVHRCTTDGCDEPAVLQWEAEPDANGDRAAVRVCTAHVPA